MNTTVPGPTVEQTHDRFHLVVFGFLVLFLLCSAFSIALTQIGYFGALALWIGSMVYRKHFSWPRTPLDLFFVAYAVVEVLSTIFSIDVLYSLLYLQRRLLLIPILYILLGLTTSVRELRILFGALVLSSLGVALYSLFPLMIHLSEYLRVQRRLGEFQIYMTAAGIMMISLMLLIPFLVHRDTPAKVRITIALVILPMLVNLYFTFTRSSWLGFVTGIIVIASFRTRKLLIILVASIAVIFLLSTPEQKELRFYALVDPGHPHNASRLEMWKVGFRSFLDHPILGVGDVGMETIWEKYADPGWPWEGHLHNNLIMWLVTLGLAGAGVLIALFVQAWILVARIERRLREDWFGGSLALGGLAVMAGFHVAGLFEWNFGDAEIIMLIWATIGLALTADRLLSPPSPISDSISAGSGQPGTPPRF
jgi:O-antigen ligase